MTQMTSPVPLWTVSDLVAAIGAVADGDPTGDIHGVSIDTRTLETGDLFVALKDQRDGHAFVAMAFEKGAAAALVDTAYARQASDTLLLRVADPLSALQALGRAARARLSSEARVVAVTGSAGKTGTKEMLRTCFASLGATHASEKSYNNHWGVPLTLARMPATTQFGVFEIGMNHADEIRPLTKMVRPDAAIVTTVEAVHLEHFANVEAIAAAKAEIFEGLGPEGVAIINADNRYAPHLISAARRCGARIVTFGFSDTADVRGHALGLDEGGSRMTVALPSGNVDVALIMPGRHIAGNALAVAAALQAVGADAETGLAGLSGLPPPVGRGARCALGFATGAGLLIDETYNANPASMRAALGTMSAIPRSRFPRRIAVLGDMLELGPDAAALHRDLGAVLDSAGIDLVFVCGSHIKGLYDALTPAMKGGYALTAAELKPALEQHLQAGDAVILKASNGMRLGPLADWIKMTYPAEARV